MGGSEARRAWSTRLSMHMSAEVSVVERTLESVTAGKRLRKARAVPTGSACARGDPRVFVRAGGGNAR